MRILLPVRRITVLAIVSTIAFASPLSKSTVGHLTDVPFVCCYVEAQETAVPTTPVPSTITSYRIVTFLLEREPDWRFVITFADSNGKLYTDIHYGLSTVIGPDGKPMSRPEGADELMKSLNTANLTTHSLIKRLLMHLEQHGKIPPMTVQGTPEVVK